MKYEVVSDRTPFQKGTTFVLDKDVSGIVFDTNNATYPAIGRDMLRQYPEDFEPIEEVQEGQYWKTGASAFPFPDKEVLRIKKTTDNHAFYQSITRNVSGNGEKKVLERHGRKLSTDEIEEVLIEEAKRRGYVKDNFKCLLGLGEKDYYIDGCGYQYCGDDGLLFKNKCVYFQGEWAEIIDQTPHIEINGYEAEFHEDYVQFGCAKIDKDFFLQWVRNGKERWEETGRGNRSVTGIKVGEGIFNREQIKKIAEYYE